MSINPMDCAAETVLNLVKHSEQQIVYYFRPEYGVEDKVGKTYGPFENFLQITYSELRAEVDGDTRSLAWKDGEGFWHVFYDEENVLSDIIIWAENSDAGKDP